MSACRDRRYSPSPLACGSGRAEAATQAEQADHHQSAVDLAENAVMVARQSAARRGVGIGFRLGGAEGLT